MMIKQSISAELKHPRPSKIRKEFSKRDQLFGFDAEGFWVSFDTNDDKESQFSFLVTAAGAVADLFAGRRVVGKQLKL